MHAHGSCGCGSSRGSFFFGVAFVQFVCWLVCWSHFSNLASSSSPDHFKERVLSMGILDILPLKGDLFLNVFENMDLVIYYAMDT